jgi:serine/threonine protein kinase/Tfp pilus assembly protein PilF
MGLSTSGRTWEEAVSPTAVGLARRYESVWRAARGSRPDPHDFLPDDARDLPGARLALLRADLSLRWEAGEKRTADWYRTRYPDLGDDTLVALIYEEFCLREEDQENPDPAEYEARYPEVASQLRRVLAIHGLVGSGQTTASLAAEGPGVAFPEAGQTIAGFHLVEELGRGAFARVFRAQERQLADRPVALKVARSGSREPQTLARLQHTHIVPVHSTRTDPATGLHLLCMPYFGRVTLARLLADPAVKVARSGAELLEALDRLGTESPPSARAAGRAALGRRSYAQAIAWWGARMAEALEHAHERGVLHRDIKPSNVLVTGDGMPMLLDFNLAREAVADDPEEATGTLGGTLDYMAPEHLEALADGLAGAVDARSDIFGLGVLLYEALMGARPFATAKGARSATELLLLTAEQRRGGAPALRATHPEVPAALEAVVQRCLAPYPDDRYDSADKLAADLQAVADDQPLKVAHEPLVSRAVRWTRRNRRAIATALPVLLASAVVTLILIKGHRDRLEVESHAAKLIDEGRIANNREDFAAAIMRFDTAQRLAEGRPALRELYRRARQMAIAARQMRTIRDNADRLFRAADVLRFRLTQFLGDLPTASHKLEEALAPFYVLKNPRWTTLAEFDALDKGRRERLEREVNELLFLWVVARDRTDDRATIESALRTCDQALVFVEPKGPWRALRKRLAARLGKGPAEPDAGETPATVTSPLACFQWGMLREREGRSAVALDWFRQAVARGTGNYWYQYYLAYTANRAGLLDEARTHFEAAVALEPTSPWARLGRGELLRQQMDWPWAWDDLVQARRGFEKLKRDQSDPEAGRELRLTQFDLAYVRQLRGDLRGARAEYDALVASDPHDIPGRAARLNRAVLEAGVGAIDRARADYDWLLARDPNDVPARKGRALLALREGAAEAAEADLSDLTVRTHGRDVDVLAARVVALLLLEQADQAEDVAARILRLSPTPGHQRLWTRTLLAQRQVDDLPIDRPEVIAALPGAGWVLAADVRASAARLEAQVESGGAAALRALLTRAVLLGALRDPAAEAEASRAVALSPLSPRVFLIRGRVRQRLGMLQAAREDAERGLRLNPEDVRLLELRGLLRLQTGDPSAALADFDRALRLGCDASVHGPRARALLALGDTRGALRDWTLALAHDPEQPRAFVGRALAYLRLHQWDQALSDLEHASDWAVDQPGLSTRIALISTRWIPGRPDQLPRVAALVRRAVLAVRANLARPGR